MAKPGKPNILIIDDDAEIRKYLEALLHRRGFQTVLAAEGEEALKMIREFDIHIILCDIEMPKLNGIEFLKAIHKLNLNTQVIIMTGVYDINNYNEAIKYATCGYLIKPFSSKELMESISLARRNISEKQETMKAALGQLKKGKAVYVLLNVFKNASLAVAVTCLSSALLIPLINVLPFSRYLNYGIYDQLQRIENSIKKPPAAINDILLVLIDDRSIDEISQRWPYPRSIFAELINNLKKCQPKLIAFDFTFIGKSSREDDGCLENALSHGAPVILGYGIDEDGKINFYTTQQISSSTSSGFVNSIKDQDEVTRRGIIYLNSASDPGNYFFSWEMQVLNITKQIDPSTFRDNIISVSFMNKSGEKWFIPVSPKTRSFPIRMRTGIDGFKRISFYRAVKGDFDPKDVQDKIVLVGISSPLLGDIHNTAIGPLAGIILKANTFLTLYTHDFLEDIPLKTELYFIITGLFLVVLSFFFLKDWRKALTAGAVIGIFFLSSYVLLTSGYLWNYSILPSLIILTYLLLTATQKIWKFPA